MRLFNGKELAVKILEELKNKIIKEKLKPKLAVFLIGEDEASKIYIRLKKEVTEKIGAEFELYKYDILPCHSRAVSSRSFMRRKKSGNPEILKQARPERCRRVQDDVINKIISLNNDKDINGIIVQLPLPANFDKDKILSVISPFKDVDGFHKENQKLFEEGNSRFEPVLPSVILMAIKDAYQCVIPAKAGIYSLDPRLRGDDREENRDDRKEKGDEKKERGYVVGKKAIALVNSDIFGNALKLVLEKQGINFQYKLKKVCLISGADEDLKTADIVITACGCPNLVRGDMIKKGAVLIDAGIFRAADGKITGDINRESVENIASFLTPVPGGIGPLVIALLLQNLYLAALQQRDKINL